MFNSYSSDSAAKFAPRYIAKLCIVGHSDLPFAVGRAAKVLSLNNMAHRICGQFTLGLSSARQFGRANHPYPLVLWCSMKRPSRRDHRQNQGNLRGGIDSVEAEEALSV